MASKSIDWDEVLVTKKPKQKEIEVSFKKVDGDGFLGFGDEPGTPGGAVEDDNGCVNSISVVSNDEWPLSSGQPHWIWITLRSIPTEEYTVTLTFTDGTLLYASDHYRTQTLEWPISPGSWESNEEGVTGIKVPLTLGDVTDLTDVNIDSGSYNVTITAVDGLGVDCWGGTASINFGPNPIENPPEDESAGGEPIAPSEPPIECQSGADCTSRFNRAELSGVTYDSIFFLREGYAESTDNDNIVFFPNTNPISGTTRGSNAFQLRDENLNVIFNGDNTSSYPSLLGTASDFVCADGLILTDPVLKYTKPASPVTTGQNGYVNNNYSIERFSWVGRLANNCAGEFFTAPNSGIILGNRRINTRRETSTGSIWPVACEVTDPTSISNADKWVGVGANTNGAEASFTEWHSIFLVEPYINSGGTNIPRSYIQDPTTEVSWPKLQLYFSPTEFCWVHDGLFGGNQFRSNTYTGGSNVSIDRFGNVEYTGSSGAGGSKVFASEFSLPLRSLSGWWTVKMEVYQSVAKKYTNESGDYGIYDEGVTYLQQRWATWYYNGKQMTPRFLTSQFTRPSNYDVNIPPHQQKNTANWSENNKYFRDGFPLEFASSVNASFATKPISFSSRWQPGFRTDLGGNTEINSFSNIGDFTTLSGKTPSDKVPVAAQVEHSDAGAGFFQSDQFKALIRTFFQPNPDYCNRIP